MAFSPDGKRIVTGSDDKTAKVWDAEKGQELPTLKGHQDFVSSVAYSPDGKRIVTGSGDKTAKVWDAATGQEVLALKGHTGVRLERGVQPRRQTHRHRQQGQDGEGVGRRRRARKSSPSRDTPTKCVSVAFSPDGKRIVSGSQ